MGLAAFRLLASSASELLGFPVRNPLGGPTRYAEAGQRVFADLTGVLRSRVGRALVPRVLDMMEARSAVILRRLSDDPRLTLTTTSVWPFARRVLRIAARYKIPLTAIRALVRPEAAHRRAAAIGSELAEQLIVAEDASPAERLAAVERMLLSGFVSLVPQIMPAAGAGFVFAGLAGKLLGDDVNADELQTVMRSLPDNVTTEMDLALWSLAQEYAPIVMRPRPFAASRPMNWPSAVTRALPAVAQRGLAADFLEANTGTGRSPKSISACRGGPRIRVTSSG